MSDLELSDSLRLSSMGEDVGGLEMIGPTNDLIYWGKDGIKPIIHTGWLCPRCEKINSPDVKQCDCEPERLPNTVIGPSETKVG